MMYGFALDSPQQDIAHEAETSTNTVCDWMNFCHDLCKQYIEENPTEIGGFNDNAQPLVIEINESKIFHRKYHRGQWCEGHWVFGGVECGTDRCFLVTVPDRHAETLRAQVERWIFPGTHIVSDAWAAYAHLEQWNNNTYTHAVIVHQHNFVAPDDQKTYTEC